MDKLPLGFANLLLLAAVVLVGHSGPAQFTFEAWPTTLRIVTQHYGENPDYYRQFYGDDRGHQGIDLGARAWTPVKCVADGYVVYVHDAEELAKKWSGFGQYVRIKHRDGYETTYAHLYDTAVRAGQEVKAGEEIGKAGNSGRSGGSHLHLRLRRWNRPIDPALFLQPLLEREYSLRGVSR